MSVIGIVCEFNPFHKGHKYLIDSVKQNGDIVVCVMSGNFVQRCEAAIFPKDVRVESALRSGADIVLELPFVYATASAECFAYNAVKILDSFGCDKIAFGTENAEISRLNTIIDIMNKPEFDNRLKAQLDKGESYAAARQKALSTFGELTVDTPNNILAVEYIKAIRRLDSKIEPVCVNRTGAGYNDDFAVGSFASATHIRSLINEGRAIDEYVPEDCCRIYYDCIEQGRMVSPEKYDVASVSLLRTRLYENSTDIANISEGLENRIDEAVKSGVSLNEIYDNAKTKRYAHSRIRRAALCKQFGVTGYAVGTEVPYCRLLGFNKAAENQLGVLVKGCKLPFIVKYSDIAKADDKSINMIFDYEEKSTDFYSLILKKPDICGKERAFSPVKI